jgi:hypothetical protein
MVPAVVVVALVGVGLLEQISAARQNLGPDPSRFTHYPAVQAAEWLRGAPEGVVMAQQVEIIHRLTGRRVEHFLATGDPNVIVRVARDQNVRYLTVNRPSAEEYFLPTEDQRYQVIDRAMPGLLALRHEGIGYRIFEFQFDHP